mmetsp:Transcript_8351/g.15195  ORF Transcript_8351/g.15195 Transcript_8351/m.15195 type:complete len:297 (+) Transcript_8351:70-960(+)
MQEDPSYLRRGRRAAALLRDAERVYDPKQERLWEKKYKFFSEAKMKATYRTFARARHDPFNKDPAWGKSVIARFAAFCSDKGLKMEDIFQHVDADGDYSLSRPEVKRALCRVLPSLSDQEVLAIFDVIDEDHSGSVSVQEFRKAMEWGRNARFNKESTERHRNPTHRMKRFPPATIDGWDHLQDADTVQGTRYEKVGTAGSMLEMCEKETSECLGRLAKTLVHTPRALQHRAQTPKYLYFGGGADSARFHKHSKTDHLDLSDMDPEASFPDPGGLDLRPGFLCSSNRPVGRPHTRG